jgi:glycosyltransferase 2 family protein
MPAQDETAPRTMLSFARARSRALRPRAAWASLQLALTIGLLCWTYGRLDFSQLRGRELSLVWLSLALACTAPAFFAAAVRWSFTAQRLGVPLPFRRALREVYLASFLNSVLPTGLAGDVLRAARHGALSARDPKHAGRAWLAVICERAAGQLVLWSILLVSLAAWTKPQLAALRPAPWLSLLALLGLCAFVGRIWLARAVTAGTEQKAALVARGPAQRADLLRALSNALLADGAFAVQLATSALVLASCTLGFACSAKGLSVPLSLSELVQIVPALLALSALPLSIGGFGLREVASASLYAGSGLDAATGVAVASVFGLFNLLGSAPFAIYTWLHTETLREG